MLTIAGIDISAIGRVANGRVLTARTARGTCGVHANSLGFAGHIAAAMFFASTNLVNIAIMKGIQMKSQEVISPGLLPSLSCRSANGCGNE